LHFPLNTRRARLNREGDARTTPAPSPREDIPSPREGVYSPREGIPSPREGVYSPREGIPSPREGDARTTLIIYSVDLSEVKLVAQASCL